MRHRQNDEPVRIYLRYIRLGTSWRCEFLQDGASAPLPKILNFAGADKLRDLAERGGGLPNLETKQALDMGISNGRGGLYLKLTHDQLRKLR
jgi:hypothetical protein